MKSEPFWSIIVPVYNETRRLDNVSKIVRYIKTLPESSELIFVNDGSTDSTLQQLLSFRAGPALSQSNGSRNLFRIISYNQNQGKGYAIKQGMLAATGKYRLFLDLDLSTPIEEMDVVRPMLGSYPVVIGTRKTKGSKVLVHQPWLRENLGKGFTFLSQVILGVSVSDFTCGFKCFSATAANKVFSHTSIYRWGFDSEALFLCRKYGFPIKEVPVTWTNDINTRVRFPQDLVTSFSELLRIRLNDLAKRYN